MSSGVRKVGGVGWENGSSRLLWAEFHITTQHPPHPQDPPPLSDWARCMFPAGAWICACSCPCVGSQVVIWWGA